MAGRVAFRGSCHPTAQPPSYDGTMMTRDRMDKAILRLQGTPVLYNHGQVVSSPIGEITRAYTDDRERLIVEGWIDRTSAGGIDAVRRMRDGTITGLSLGMQHDVAYTREGPRVVDSVIDEVSITEDPDLPHTELQHVGPDSSRWKLAQRGIILGMENVRLKTANYKTLRRLCGSIGRAYENERSTTMSDTKQAPAQTTTATPPAAAKPTSELTEEELQSEVAAATGENEQHQLQGTELAKLEDMMKKDPEKFMRMVKSAQSTQAAQQEKMEKDSTELLDYVTQLFALSGNKAPEQIVELITNGHKEPEMYEPMHQLISTAASAAADSKVKQSEVEKNYQTMKADYEGKLTEEKRKVDVLNEQRQRGNKLNAMKRTMDDGAPADAPASKKGKPSEELRMVPEKNAHVTMPVLPKYREYLAEQGGYLKQLAEGMGRLTEEVNPKQ